MKVVVAGATGALAAALIPRLVRAGHEVTGLSRSPAATPELRELGARLAVADLLDGSELRRAIRPLEPDVVVHAAKAIPKRGPLTYRDMRATNRLHDEGTHNLLRAARDAGASRFIAESIVFAYGYGDLGPDELTEADPPALNVPRAKLHEEVDGVLAMERHVRDAAGAIDGVVLRFGLFYGPRAGTEVMATMLRRRMLPLPGGGDGVWPLIYIGDAADAVVAALDSARPGQTYNVVDDEPVSLREFVTALSRVVGAPPPWPLPAAVSRIAAPYFTEVACTSMRVSNRKAKVELGWVPEHPDYRAGLAAWSAQRAGER